MAQALLSGQALWPPAASMPGAPQLADPVLPPQAQVGGAVMRFNGPALRDARTAKGIKQGEMARMVGCSQDLLSRFERGVVGSNNHQLAHRLAEALGVEVESIVATWEQGRPGRKPALDTVSSVVRSMDAARAPRAPRPPKQTPAVVAEAAANGASRAKLLELEREVAIRDALKAAQTTIEQLIGARSMNAEVWLRSRAEIIGHWGRAVMRLERLGVWDPGGEKAA